jgi:hypothetical protein
MPGPNSETRRSFSGGLGCSIVVQYSVGSVNTFYGRITAREYVDSLGNQVHPMIQTLFLNNNSILLDYSAPIHTVETVQSWFEKHEGEL